MESRGVTGLPYKILRGTDAPQSKLTESQVRDIYHSELSLEQLAKEYHISKTSVMNIKKRRTYRSVSVKEVDSK